MDSVQAEPEEQESEALARLYSDFASENLAPLWTQTAGLMPSSPEPSARPYHWSWELLLPMAKRAGALVPVGRGGERRAIALANPGLGGRPFISQTLWAAVQYLGPGEVAPAHRHSQGAFRFVLEGDGVWTVVDGDPVAMRRGDLLLTPGMSWHEHQNASPDAMVWMDGLDIPLVAGLDAGFFEFGPDELSDSTMPAISRSERIWGQAGIQPISGVGAKPHSPLVAYRWEHSDAALAAQLELELEGYPSTVEPGHAGIRFTNPTTGGDALSTLRTEMHRLRAKTRTSLRNLSRPLRQLVGITSVDHRSWRGC
jgi:gentisate 1,2-dioxygenase